MKTAVTSEPTRIPRDQENDYTHESAATRREFVQQHCGTTLSHVAHYSLDPGSSNNGAHAANALAALFIATGQDAANIAESHAAITYTQELENGDFYWSITLPSVIVATYGGGTGLATQKECLEMLGCYGKGKAKKFAEICAAVVLAGETSLISAIMHGGWVSAHEKLGRNRP